MQMDGPAVVTPDSIGRFREMTAQNAPTSEALGMGGTVDVTEHEFVAPDGAHIGLLVLRPTVRDLAPLIYHMHGGGMVMGDNRTGVEVPLSWALEFGAVVVSVDYRLAPEFPDPVPIDDCYAGLAWTVEHATELGIDSERIVVAGASAGGGLSAGLALMARDRKWPAIIGQVLMGPMLDDRNTTPSSYELIGEGIWDRTSNETGWDALLGGRRGSASVSAYAAPSRATDLSHLPAAYIDVGSAEMFRDEAVDFAVRLWRAGSQAELHVWPGGFHAFELLAPHAALSVVSAKTRQAWVGRLLSADWSGRAVTRA
jgi:acetyl esterase/lipase